MTTPTPTRAIGFALEQKWNEAIAENEQLLNQNPSDIETLNRLGFALMKKGYLKKAKAQYKKVLSIDSAHPIASKMLKRLEGATFDKQASMISTNPFIFLEEPGRTKMVTLCKLAGHKILFSLSPGQKVVLIPKRFTIEVRSTQKIYLGVLPDDLSYRLLPFIAGGNEYEAYVNHVEKNELSIFIKELKRGKKFRTTPSFISTNSNYTPFIREDLLQPGTQFEPGELGHDEEER